MLNSPTGSASADIEAQFLRTLNTDPQGTRGRAGRHRGTRFLVVISTAQEAASAPRRKGPRHDQHGTRGRVNPEAQGPAAMVGEVHEAAVPPATV